MARPRKATMRDVAREAGVSYQTVSRVINDHPSVAPATRERILQVIAKLNYRPSKVARSLVTRQSRTLSVVTYGLSHYGPTQMMANIEQAAKSSDYDLIFANINPDDDQEELFAIIQDMERHSIDGLILIAPVRWIPFDHLVEQFRHLPIVQLDVARGASVPSVVIDQHEGGYEVTNHLLELGHMKLAEISGPLDWYGAQARHAGFLQALSDANLVPAASIEGDWTPQSGYECAQQLLDNENFTALVVGNDQMALGAIRALHERNLCIPEDISIVGFDDIPEAPYFSPPLTTVRQEFSQLGKLGVEYLVSIIEDSAITQQKTISPRLIVRKSTAPPAGHT